MTYPPQQPGQPYPQQPQQPGGYPQQQPGAYPPPGYPQQGYQAAPPPAVPPKKKGKTKVVLLAVAGVFLLCCGGGAIYALASGGGSSSSSDGSTTNAGAAPAGAKHAKLGQAVRDGKFEFVAQKVDCGKTQVGTADFGEKAQGQFCLVSVSVKNISNQPQTFDGGDQKAIGSSGAKYDNSTAAETDANQGNETFLNNINPGNQVTGVLVYDIPKDATIKTLELHDSPFSGGVMVDVG